MCVCVCARARVCASGFVRVPLQGPGRGRAVEDGLGGVLALRVRGFRACVWVGGWVCARVWAPVWGGREGAVFWPCACGGFVRGCVCACAYEGGKKGSGGE